jgi:hypothetical protein
VTALLFPFFLIAGLIVPGWLLARTLQCTAGLLGAFLGSAALLVNTLLLLDAIHGDFRQPILPLALASLCLVFLVIGKCNQRKIVSESPLVIRIRFERYHWLLLPGAIGFAAIAAKSAFDPLSGLDTVFRWDHLAREMFLRGNLQFYPPVSANDFLKYPWCDGISPLISTLYYWAYLAIGAPIPEATVPLVIIQGYLLFATVYNLAKSRGGPAAGCAAVGILGTSAVLLSGIAIGQETGMTPLALVAMFLYIEKHRESERKNYLVFAGIAAGIGGLAREYGIIFVGFGALALVTQRPPLREWLKFTLTALAVMLPWYFRNWIKTGNPLFSHNIADLFPTNPIHMGYMKTVDEVFGFWTRPSAVQLLFSIVGLLAGVPLALGVLSCIQRRQRVVPWIVAALAVSLLWLWSVSQTSGGYHYSLRVLTPALAVVAVLGGLLLTSPTLLRYTGLVALGLSVPAIDAAQRTLFMPLDPMVPWWQNRLLAWREHRQRAEAWASLKSWDAVVDAAGARMILTNDPGTWSLLHNRGAPSVPVFSPQVRFLFDPASRLDECLHRLRVSGFRFIVIARADHVSQVQLGRVRFFSSLNSLNASAKMPFGDVYDLYASDLMAAAKNLESTFQRPN